MMSVRLCRLNVNRWNEEVSVRNMTYYLRVMLGAQSIHAKDCIREGIVGTDFNFDQDLSGYLLPTWNESRRELTRIYKEFRPDRTPIALGLNCGAIWTVSKGLPIGGIVVSPVGNGEYIYGEVTSNYQYVEGSYLPHQRTVNWSKDRILGNAMSELLLRACKLPLTAIDLNPYAAELDLLIGKQGLGPRVTVNDENVEDASRFALEAILEEFLVSNWKHTAFAEKYKILEVDGVLVGQQFLVDTGRIDLLAISHDDSEYLVLELKRGQASDKVVGQLLRYMGFIKREYCNDEHKKKVRGAIVAHEDDQRIRDALSMVCDVDFYKYSIDFKLAVQKLGDK